MANNEGTPLHGDRSAWNTTEHADEHARDINESALQRHLPEPGAVGGLARSDGTDWQRVSDLVLEGTQIIDVTSEEALVVRKNADGGDVVIVDTTNDELEMPTGSIKLVSTTTSATGIIFKGADRFIHDFHHPTGGGALPVGQNTFIGDIAGNFTMGSTATQIYHGSGNVGIGYRALISLTTGYSNSAVGSESMHASTTANANVAIGEGSLKLNVSGNSNVAVGTEALKFNTASFNTAVGMEALLGNIGGVGNTAVGRRAGRYIADGSTANTTSDFSVYLGRATKAGADNNQNEIVIGYDAIGAGSNTIMLGNSAITLLSTYGTMVWLGDVSGIPYGHMYTNDTIAVTITDTTPVEVGDTWTTGEVNLITFGADHFLTVTKAGRYKIDWSMSIAQNSPSAKIEVEGGIMIDGTAQVEGRSHRTIANASDTGASSSTAILDLAADEQISLYIVNETNATDIDVEHANVTVTMCGGT